MWTQRDSLIGAVAPSSPRQPLTSQCRRSASFRENLVHQTAILPEVKLDSRLTAFVTTERLDAEVNPLVALQIVIAVLMMSR